MPHDPETARALSLAHGQVCYLQLPAADRALWLAVADMSETLERVARYGGQVLEPPVPDGPTRTLATITDPEGNRIGLAGHAPPGGETR